MTHWTEARIAAHLEGRFYLIDGTDKNEVDAKIIAQRQADKIRERQELAAMTRIEQMVQAAEEKTTLPPDAIITAVASAHRVSPEDITGGSRKPHFVHARQHACALLREFTALSYPAIGRAIGGRDHATVLHGVQRWTQRGHVYANEDKKARQMLGVGQ